MREMCEVTHTSVNDNVSTAWHLHTCQPLSALSLSGRSQLHSAEVHQQLFVPRIRTTVMGSRGFYYAAPVSWNALPALLRDPNLTLTDFRLMLKTVLF